MKLDVAEMLPTYIKLMELNRQIFEKLQYI